MKRLTRNETTVKATASVNGSDSPWPGIFGAGSACSSPKKSGTKYER